MIIILCDFPGNSTALKVFHDLSFKKKKKQKTIINAQSSEGLFLWEIPDK